MFFSKRKKSAAPVMPTAEVGRRLAAFVTARSPLAGSIALTAETRVFSTGLLDSLAFVELVAFVERDLGTSLSEIPDVSMDRLDRLGDVVALVTGEPGDAAAAFDP